MSFSGRALHEQCAAFCARSRVCSNMPNSIVRSVLLSLFLVVLCIYIGAEVAEDRTVALGTICVLVGTVFMIWVGKRSWVLIYLLPPVISLLPLPGKLSSVPVMFLVSVLVLFYWFVMWGMGYVRVKWRSLLVLDLLVLVMFGYMVASYVRHPVSLAIFGYDAEFVGGKEYVWCIVATLHYITISCIPCDYEQLRKVTHWGVRLSVAACLLGIVLALVGVRGSTDITQLSEDAVNTRFTMFVMIGTYGIYYLYGRYPILRILASPGILFGCALSLFGVVLSGAREYLMGKCFLIATLAVIKRELWILTLMGVACYGALLYLSAEGIVEKFPHGVQRCFSVLPGVKIDREIRAGTEHSSEWRIEMWRWALDPRTNYIQDYVWGDGFGQSVDYLRRETTAMMRGTVQFGDQDFFASTGTWHSGVITTIHRLGYVGLSLVALLSLTGTFLMYRAGFAWYGTGMFLPFMFYTMSFAEDVPIYFISAGALPYFFKMYMALAFIKLFYCVGRERGCIVPMLQPQRYVPLVIREQEAQN